MGRAIDNFRQNLATIIAARDLPKIKLSRTAGISRPTIDLILKGPFEPRLTTCERLAQACGLPLAAMLAPADEFAAFFAVRHVGPYAD